MSRAVVQVWSGVRSGNLRWGILLLLFLVTVLNYFDRQTLSVLAPQIKTDLGINNQAYAHVVLGFMVANALAQLAFGPFLDRVGTRVGLAVAVAFWSVAAALPAFAAGALSLLIFRVLLGAGEAGNWPAASKAVAEWFPAKERGFAMGFFNGGTAIGAILAPPVAVFVAAWFGWRAAFLVSGLIGFAWLLFWLRLYHSPSAHPRISSAELQLIQDAQALGQARPKALSKRTLLGDKAFWAILLARFITTPVWWFVAYWLPIYLGDRYGFNLVKIGLYAWIPFLTADLGNMLGGWFSGRLIAEGYTAVQARRVVLGFASVLMVASIPAAFAASALWALTLISILTFAFGAWAANILALAADSFPRKAVGTVVSWSGTAAVAGGALFTYFIGEVADTSYLPVFLTAGAMPLAGYAAIYFWSSEPGPPEALGKAREERYR